MKEGKMEEKIEEKLHLLVVSTFLLQEKGDFTIKSVGPKAEKLLSALEGYRKNGNIVAFARELNIHEDHLAVYRALLSNN